MEKSRVASSGQLEVLEFNDEQLAKVGAALQAMADQMSTANESMRENVIDLLSDSDCEDENAQISDISLQAQLQGQADENQTQNNYSKHTPGTFVVNCVQKGELAYKTLEWHQPYAPDPNLTDTIGYLENISQPEDLDTSATLSVSSESLNVQNKFNYETVEPNNVEKGINSNQHPRPGRSTYITLTDITGEQIQVKEMNVSHLLNNSDVLPSPETKVKMQQTFLQNVNGNQLVNEKWLVEEKPGFQTEQASMQPFYENEKGFLKLDAYPNEDSVYSLTSREDSNGNSAVFGTDIMDIDNVSDDNAAELSDHSTKHILIDLVDSETEDEQETGEYRPVDVSKNRSNTSSIDCFMMYSCPECGLECGNAFDWKLHTDTEHKFATIGALNMQTIIDKAGHICYQCRDCALKFELHKNFYKLLSHRISHLPNENYVRCRICDMSFRNKSFFRRHLSKMHYKICRDYLEKGKRPNVYAMKYVKITCPMCNQHIENRKQWHVHLEDSHDFSRTCMSQVSLVSNDVYVCSMCDVKMRKRSIPEHMLAHEKTKSFSCTYCNKYETSHIGMALTHVRRVHLMPANESIFKCKYCEETFQKISHRKNHLRQEHKVKRPKCAICDKEFFSISLLLSHMNFANHHKLK